MSARTFLNALRRDDRRLPEPEPGRWKPYPNFLVDYGADIAVDGQLEDRRGLANVPTVFARPIYFAQALADARHPAHRAVCGQWRGLLAVFALQRWLGLPVATEQVTIPEKPTAAADGARTLWTILHSQLPRPEAEWDHWWLLRCEDRLIGATSPWTVVYTPTEYSCSPRIPWQRDGLLVDPLEHFDRAGTGGRSVELSLLAIWLDRMLQVQATRFGVVGRGHLDRYLEVVTRQLIRWRSELERYRLQEHASLPIEHAALHIEEAPYSVFIRALEVQPRQNDSDLLLDSRLGKVIVLKRQGVEPRARVYGPSLGSDLDLGLLQGPVVPAGWKTRSGREVPLPCLFADEAFFPRRLAALRSSAAAWSPTSESYALPLTPLFFKYFDLEDLLRRRVRLELQVEDRRVIARLRLTLSGTELIVERAYDKDTEVVGIADDTPALACWPDFYDPAWRHNFAIVAAPARGSLLTTAPLLAGGETLSASRTDGTERRLRVWPSAKPILGFALAAVEEDGSEDAGIVLRGALEAPANHGRAWKVAVDFGTSNTHLLVFEEGVGEKKPLDLAGRTVLLTKPGAEADRLAATLYFYPEEEVKLPVPTLLHRDEATIYGEQFATRRRLLARFRFVPDPRQVEGIVTEVKWGREPGSNEEAPLRAYLQDLTTAVACEAWAQGVSTLDLKWSYPMSLSEGGRNTMVDFWTKVAGDHTVEEGGVFRFKVTVDTAGVSESVALCRSLARRNALPLGADGLSVAVDIGGGSTDVGFWIGGRLRGQVSMKLAGNDLLVPFAPVTRFVTELERLCEPDADKRLGPEPYTRRPAVLLNALLSRGANGHADGHAHPVARALAGELPRGEHPWLGLRSLIYLYAAGVAFSLGLHARRWLAELKIQEVHVGFGGRGSGLLSWVTNATKLEQVLEGAFREGAMLGSDLREIPVRFYLPGGRVQRWARLKEEAVEGLLSPPLPGEEAVDRDRVPALEINWTDDTNKPVEWTRALTVRDLAHLVPPGNLDSSYVAHLVAEVLPRWAAELGVDGDGLSRLRPSSASLQAALRQTDPSRIFLQPLFAYELRALVESYAEGVVSAGG